MKPRRLITWINRIVGVGAILLVALLIIFYFWVHSPSGMWWLADMIRHATDDQVRLYGLSGKLPHHLRVDALELYDDEHQLWLTATNLQASLRPHQLLRRQAIIHTAQVEGVAMLISPEYHASPPRDTNRPPSMLRLQRLQVEAVHVARFTMTTNIFGHSVEADVRGDMSWETDGVLFAQGMATATLNQQITADISGRIALSNSIMHLADIQVMRDADRGEMDGRYDIKQAKFDFHITSSIQSLRAYHSLLPFPLDGDAQGDFTISRSARNDPVHIAMDVKATQLAYQDFQVKDVNVQGHVRLDQPLPSYQMNIRIHSVHYPSWQVSDFDAQGTSESGIHSWAVQGQGVYDDRFPFTLQVAGDMTQPSDERDLSMVAKSLSGTWSSIPFRIDAPLAYRRTSAGDIISADQFSVNGLQTRAHATLIHGVIDELAVTVAPFDLERLYPWISDYAPDISGQAALHVVWTNGAIQPQGYLQVTADDVSIDHSLLQHFRASRYRLNADIRPNGVFIVGEAIHPLITKFRVSSYIPLKKFDHVLPLTFDPSHEVDVSIELDGNLKQLSETLISSPTAIGGRILIDLHARDILNQPTFMGAIELRGGDYRNIGTGTFLDQINVHIVGRDDQLVIQKASATDGGSGRVTATGHLAMNGDRSPTWDVTATLTNATIFRLVRTELPLSGDVRAIKTNDQAWIQGKLWLEPFRFVIPRRLPPSIPRIDVIEINHPNEQRNSATEADAPLEVQQQRNGKAIRFDIEVKTRNRFEVSGRGLQSAWRGNLFVRGSSLSPRLMGSIQLVDGYVMLLGRRFILDDGQIQFTGDVPPNPNIFITASTRIGDTVARLVANGSVNQPHVALTSDPLLPDDEIMALILFGKSVETMSPWQAIALANGLRILAGANDLVTVMDSSQSLIRVDQIDIRQDEEGEGSTSIAVGKYFGRRLYVEGEKGFGQAEDSVTVTIELTPRLILETEASPRIREGISLFWRREF